MDLTEESHINAQSFWVPLRPTEHASTRLFMFPFAGGSAHSFNSLMPYFPASWEIFGLQLPGRGSRLAQAPLHQFSLALEEVISHQAPLLDRPSIFWGHSLGAIMAYEVSRHWSREGGSEGGMRKPAALVISAAVAPRYWPSARGNSFKILDTKDLAQALRQYGDTFADLLDDEEILEFLLPTVKADFDIIESYRYGGCAELETPILVFHGVEDQIVSSQKVLDWKEETRGAFATKGFPGGHYFYREQESEIISALVEFLEKKTGQFQAISVN